MRRARDATQASPIRHANHTRASRATVAPSLPRPVLLFVLAALSLVAMYISSNQRSTNLLVLANRPSGFRVQGEAGVHPDFEENMILELAEPTPLDGIAAPANKFAYLFYVTEETYVCVALHAMQRLVRDLHMDRSRIDLLVLYSNGVGPDKVHMIETTVFARTIPIVRILADVADVTWQESLTKLRAFENFGYERVVFIDSDAVPMQNLDDLFSLPPAPLYAPTAYWLAQPFFATTLMVIEPDNKRFLEILQFARTHGESLSYDMEVLNAYFQKSVLHLPSEYSVLNSDFRAPPSAQHATFKVATSELRRQAKLVHFSCLPDGSYGKPWAVETHDIAFLKDEGFDPLFGQMFLDYWRTEETLCKK